MELLEDERQLIQTSLIDLIVNSYKSLFNQYTFKTSDAINTLQFVNSHTY